ncbi:MAG TPA: alpha/beta hydrolase [Clostridia bacterium]|nr:alpha/beta hydrolase [Clostridia bacterium]
MIRLLPLAGLLVSLTAAFGSEPAEVVELWPESAPGDTESTAQERDTTKPTDREVAGKPVIRLGNVSRPTLSIFRPPSASQTGAAVLVCPGGGYQILAADLEGTEVCEWLNSIGVTAGLLKYRVPQRSGRERYAAALEDAQRALSLLRSRGPALGVDTNRIGVLGFSAGGHLAAVLSTGPAKRVYGPIDSVDQVPFRPNFTVLIYPAYLTVKERGDQIAPELSISSNTPPTFIAMSQDDPVRVETALFYAAALKRAHAPFELHVYPTGGHGYGLRPGKDLVTTWPKRTEDWMRSCGLCQTTASK